MRRILWPLLFLVWGVALAQTSLTTFDGGAFGFRLGYPAGWVLQSEGEGSYLNIQPPPGSAEAGRVAIELLADPAVTDTTLDEGVDDVLAELRANLLPDLTVQSRSASTVSGVPAVVVRLTGSLDGTEPVTYRLVLTLQGTTGYVLFLEAASADFADFEPLFDQVQASFALTPTQTAPNPLGAPTFAGTFAGDRLRLVLEAPSTPGGAYLGTLHQGDQRYPVRAQLDPLGLVGDFESGGQRFAFTATLAGDELTFVSDGNRYVLRREVAAPVAPVNPIGATPPVAPVDAPAASAEIVVRETGTADVGALAPNGRARGRLDGLAGAFTFHAFFVDVPTGATRLTIELDADADLDLAVKQGSEILNYSDLDQGGDWDYRDIGTQNPTTIVVDVPAPGRWHIDVINVLGAGQNGTYVLTLTTDGATGGAITPAAPVDPFATTRATPPEVVASETGTAFVGALPPDGRARGRLDGAAERITFHTYVVDVPAGVARLVIELDADTDLDLAVKGGSEIESYSDLDRGGDWDYRDLGTQNPTTIVVDRPAPGPWYVDVVNALGAGHNGTYRLTLATAGGSF